MERQAAKAARGYHERIVRPNLAAGRRDALAAFATEFHRDRLKVPPSPGLRRTLDVLRSPDTMVVEIAHDGQLPHLGVVRMVLKADEIARADGRASVLYLIGNHYTPGMRPDNLHYGMPLKGQPPGAVQHPPRIRVGRSNLHIPFRLLPPPADTGLDELHRLLTEYVAHNVGHERRAGTRVSDEDEARVLGTLRGQFHTLRRIAGEVGSFGDWLIRVQHELFREMIGDRADRVVFLPMAEVAGLLREDLTTIARRGGAQDLFWLYCPECHRRQRAAWRPDSALDFLCAACGHRAHLEGDGLWAGLMPDVVAFQAALFRIGVGGWVAGSHADYQPVIERTYREVFDRAPPPTFFLTTVPRFRGLGDPVEGFPKTRLLRALLEVPARTLARALSGPWDEDPSIVSEIFARRAE